MLKAVVAFYILRILMFVSMLLVCYVYARLIILKNKKKIDVNFEIEHVNSLCNFKVMLKKNILKYFFGLQRYVIFRLGLIPSHRVRIFIYKLVFKMNLDSDVTIYYGSEIRCPENIFIGQGTIIGDKSILDGRNGIIIGKNVNFSTEVHVWTLQHDYNSSNFELDKFKGKVVIHDRVWIGPRVTILPGVIIGEGAVIAAGSVVTKSIGSYTLAAGIPCKEIGIRNTKLVYEFKQESHIPFL